MYNLFLTTDSKAKFNKNNNKNNNKTQIIFFVKFKNFLKLDIDIIINMIKKLGERNTGPRIALTTTACNNNFYRSRHF